MLEDKSSETNINKLKTMFATHGISTLFISDNGSNYTSHEFSAFAWSWDFKHETSSPYHSQSNGKAESAVKFVKSMLRKTSSDGDFWKALLGWRNTVTPSMTQRPETSRDNSDFQTNQSLNFEEYLLFVDIFQFSGLSRDNSGRAGHRQFRAYIYSLSGKTSYRKIS